MRPKASGHVVGFHFFGAASENARGFVRTGYVGKDAAQGSRIGELRAYDGVDGADDCPEAGSALHAFILIDGGISAVGSGDDGSDGAVGSAADAVRGNEHFGVLARRKVSFAVERFDLTAQEPLMTAKPTSGSDRPRYALSTSRNLRCFGFAMMLRVVACTPVPACRVMRPLRSRSCSARPRLAGSAGTVTSMPSVISLTL